MFKKWFGKKKKDDQVVERDEWIQRDYILVSNDTTPDDLKEYQKLIVLRKPEGEKRCVVDYSLSYDDVDKLQYESIVSGEVNLFDENLKRIIPTYLNTKENDFDLDNVDEDELHRMSKLLKETSNELKLTEVDFENRKFNADSRVDIPILKTDNIVGKILTDKMSIFQYEQEKKKSVEVKNNPYGADDIDGIDILTEVDLEIRDSWTDVDTYFETEESIERRQSFSDEDKTVSPFYVPKIQPLFRNFIDINFADMKPMKSISKMKDTANEWYEDVPEPELINEVEMVESNDANFNVEEETFIDLCKQVSEDPEIVMGDIDNNVEYVEEMEQPKVLSFFKNEVDVNRSYHGQSEHINKHVQFYKSNRDYVYEKVVLDKKRGIFNVRKRTIVEK